MSADGKPALAFALKAGAKKPQAPLPGLAASDGQQRDYVTGMGGGALASERPTSSAALPVIPALPNTFKTGEGKRPRGVRARAAPRGGPEELRKARS